MANDGTRYDRQARLPQIGEEGQTAIQASSAAVLGLGALGCVAADLLARAGVGRLVLVDRDVVEWSNLQRQALYTEADAEAGRPKVEAAAERLARVNSEIEIQAVPADLVAGNAPALLGGADLLLDGTDNFAARYLLNDFAVREEVPYVYAGVVGTYGMIGAIVPGGPCLRCTYPEPAPAEESPTCRTAGVLGPAVAVISGLAAGEALKLLSDHPEAVTPGYRYLDLWSGESHTLAAARDPECPCCGARDFPWLRGERGGRKAEPLCGGNAVQIPAETAAPDLSELARKLGDTVEGLEQREGYLRFRSAGLDLLLFADGRALVRGTEDPGRARALLARTVGS